MRRTASLASAADEAADNLLAIVKADRTWNDDGARAQLLKLFEAWGPMDEATLDRLSEIAEASRYLLCQTEDLRSYLEGSVPAACGRSVLFPPVVHAGPVMRAP